MPYFMPFVTAPNCPCVHRSWLHTNVVPPLTQRQAAITFFAFLKLIPEPAPVRQNGVRGFYFILFLCITEKIMALFQERRNRDTRWIQWPPRAQKIDGTCRLYFLAEVATSPWLLCFCVVSDASPLKRERTRLLCINTSASFSQGPIWLLNDSSKSS